MGVDVQVDVVRWGFYPAGGGEMRVRIAGRNDPLRPIVLTERGELQRVWGIAAAMNLPAHIAQRMAVRAQNVLEGEALRPVRVDPRRLRGSGPGAGIFLFADYAGATAGFTAYGRRGLASERVTDNVCRDVLAHHRGRVPLEPYLVDQLVVPMAVAEGASRLTTSRVSSHLLTNVWAVRQFLAVEINLEGELGKPGILELTGRGI
jgi:RNA 3'-terminal phosphate cyclase (ATP)